MKTIQKYSHINPVIIDYILSSKINNPNILDVGCWDGTLGKLLKKHKYKCFIDGIDISKEALSRAKRNGYRNTYCIDLNQIANYKIRKKYDLIILGDVLEHLIDPDKSLSKIIQSLSEGGRLIVSLPNIGFIKYRLLHLLGRWNYTKTGIMDKTHLRFFTLKSMKKMFLRHRLNIIDCKGFSAVPNSFWYFKILGRLWPSLFALQIIFLLE